MKGVCAFAPQFSISKRQPSRKSKETRANGRLLYPVVIVRQSHVSFKARQGSCCKALACPQWGMR